MGSRTWIKVYCDKWLEGTISEESISVRGVWISLLALAGNGNYGDSGEIKALDGVGFNNNQVAAMLKVSLNLWVATKNRLEKTGRVTISNDNIITIVNWKKYQSEYERTSKYRIKDTTTATTKGTLREREERIEKESREEKETTSPEIKKIEFEEYIEELRPQFADIKFDSELKKFHLYWSEGNRKLKRPKLALLNWMEKAREIKAEKKPPGKNAGVNRINSDDPDKYTKGKYGHMVQR